MVMNQVISARGTRQVEISMKQMLVESIYTGEVVNFEDVDDYQFQEGGGGRLLLVVIAYTDAVKLRNSNSASELQNCYGIL